MTGETLGLFGQIAGIGGLALGVFMILFRDVIRKNIFARLSPQQSYRAVRLVLVLTWSLALLGLSVWVYVSERADAIGQRYFPKALPFNTGWIFAGYYDNEKKIYVEGPFLHVAYRPGAGERGSIAPSIGDVAAIRKERRVIIADFKVSALKHQMTSPPLLRDPLTEDDETGYTLSKNALVIVRDVEISGYPNRPVSNWCRVAACDTNTDACAKALVER